jgi:hypothetical protein
MMVGALTTTNQEILRRALDEAGIDARAFEIIATESDEQNLQIRIFTNDNVAAFDAATLPHEQRKQLYTILAPYWRKMRERQSKWGKP